MSEQHGEALASGSGELDQLTLYKTYLAAAKVRLFKTTLAPTPDTLVAAFIAAEANYAGYAAVVPTYSAIGLSAEGDYEFVSSRMFYQATDAVTPNQIAGYWWESAGGVLQGYAEFDPPLNMTTALAFMALTLTFNGVPHAEHSVEY